VNGKKERRKLKKRRTGWNDRLTDYTCTCRLSNGPASERASGRSTDRPTDRQTRQAFIHSRSVCDDDQYNDGHQFSSVELVPTIRDWRGGSRSNLLVRPSDVVTAPGSALVHSIHTVILQKSYIFRPARRRHGAGRRRAEVHAHRRSPLILAIENYWFPRGRIAVPLPAAAAAAQGEQMYVRSSCHGKEPQWRRRKLLKEEIVHWQHMRENLPLILVMPTIDKHALVDTQVKCIVYSYLFTRQLAKAFRTLWRNRRWNVALTASSMQRWLKPCNIRLYEWLQLTNEERRMWSAAMRREGEGSGMDVRLCRENNQPCENQACYDTGYQLVSRCMVALKFLITGILLSDWAGNTRLWADNCSFASTLSRRTLQHLLIGV
jgi:hypothetical protein